MRYPWTAIAIGSAVIGALGLAAFAGRSTKPLERVALIGDSYAVGLGPRLAKLFPAFRFEGHVGSGTAAWANGSPDCGRCGNWLAAFRPSVVLISLGVNDAAPNPSDYHQIVQRLHGLGARILWIDPPAAVQTPARDVIASLGVNVVPATKTPMAADGLHPRNYRSWANEVAEAVARG